MWSYAFPHSGRTPQSYTAKAWIKVTAENWGQWHRLSHISTYRLPSGIAPAHSPAHGLEEANAISGSNSAFRRCWASGFSLLKKESSNCWEDIKSTEASNWDLVIIRRDRGLKWEYVFKLISVFTVSPENVVVYHQSVSHCEGHWEKSSLRSYWNRKISTTQKCFKLPLNSFCVIKNQYQKHQIFRKSQLKSDYMLS